MSPNIHEIINDLTTSNLGWVLDLFWKSLTQRLNRLKVKWCYYVITLRVSETSLTLLKAATNRDSHSTIHNTS